MARDARRTLFGGMFVHDGFTVFFTLLFCAIGAFAVLLSWDYVKRTRINHAEYYALLLCATLGMVLMAASNDLITIFLGLELMSLALYVLVGFRRDAARVERGGAQVLPARRLRERLLPLRHRAALRRHRHHQPREDGRVPRRLAPARRTRCCSPAGCCCSSGFAFKVAAVPFHMWTPDAYEGAPTSVTAFMSVGAKAAAFAALLRFGLRALGGFPAEWVPVLSAVAMLTMTVGNVTALLQNNLKRMLAYSSIAHAGYVLVAVAAGGPDGASAALFYLAVYSVMNLGAFGVLTILGRGAQERVLMADLAGLGFRRPFVGLALTVFMISLGGIPPTAGFMGKVYVFGTALKAGLLPLVIVGVLNSVVSVYYYLRVTVAAVHAGAAGRADRDQLGRARGRGARAGAGAHALVGRAGRRRCSCRRSARCSGCCSARAVPPRPGPAGPYRPEACAVIARSRARMAGASGSSRSASSR